MRYKRAGVVLFLAVFLLAAAAGYTGEGNTDSGSGGGDGIPGGCSDDTDNDGDGFVDGKDPGCTKPYALDDNEGHTYDGDASWVFSEESAPTADGPSIFYGFQTFDKDNPDAPFPDTELSVNEVNESYVEDSVPPWGGGRPSFSAIQISGANVTTEVTDFAELVTSPNNIGEASCGDGLKNDALTEEAGMEQCPKDYQFKEEIVLDDSERKSLSLKYDVEMSSRDFECVEAHGDEDIGDLDGGHHFPVASGDTDNWDFYRNSVDWHVVMAAHCTKSTSDLDTIDDYDLSGNSRTLAGASLSDIDQHGDQDSERVYYCTGKETVYSDELDQEELTRTYELVQEISAVESGGLSAEIQKQGGDNLADNNLDVTFTRDTADENVNEYTVCTGTEHYDPTCDDEGSCIQYAVSGYQQGSSQTVYEAVNDPVTLTYGDWEVEKEKVLNTNSEDSEDDIFHGDPNSKYKDSNVVTAGTSEGRMFYPEVTNDGRQQGNDPAISSNHYRIAGEVDDDYFIAERTKGTVLDADGPKGQSDGFVAIDTATIDINYYNNMVGWTENFAGTETQDGSQSGWISPGGSFPEMDCPGQFYTCVASIDLNTSQKGWYQASNNAFKYETVSEDHFSTNRSLGVCMMYKRLSGDKTVQCRYEGSNVVSSTSKRERSCGDREDQWWAYMEGPEVDDLRLNKSEGDEGFSAAQQACIDKVSDCVLNGKDVANGTVANVAYSGVSGFEMGGSSGRDGDSPDREVCLRIPDKENKDLGDTFQFDNHYDLDNDEDCDTDGFTGQCNRDYDNDRDGDDDVGGAWFDLDNEKIHKYIRGTDIVTGDSNGDGVVNASDLSYYWNENPNPQHPQYNPAGGRKGTALEDDCGPDLLGCDDAGNTVNGKSGLFYSFLEEGMRDEDYNPEGRQDEGTPTDPTAMFYGHVNKIEDDSDQLEPGMPTARSWDISRISIWNDSVAGTNEADMYALASSPAKSISNRGRVFGPGNVYYHKDYTGFKRSQPSDPSVSKKSRAFGNSFAANATAEIDTDGDGVNEVQPGEGTWIDPDYLKEGWERGEYADGPGWRRKLSYRMDITGPDVGLGFDIGEGTGVSFVDPGRRYVAIGNIYFEGENDGKDNDGDDLVDEDENWEGTDIVGETSPYLEPPMCGDDQREYLIEELGESSNPEKLDGMYACVDQKNKCVDLGSSPRIVESGVYKNAGEPDADVGRLKNDKEVCLKADENPDDDLYTWYDQDFGDIDGDGEQDTCRENALYGEPGIRWFDAEYIRNHPFAVKRGIDDDWNARLEQRWELGEFTGNYTSNPQQVESRTDIENNRWSPVPTGSPNETIATLGFCGGDDEDEQIVVQRCRANSCETDTSVMGVAENNRRTSCILDQDSVPLEGGGDKWKLYRPGENVTLDYGPSKRVISCFDGTWYGDWPIVFQEDSVEVGRGETRTVSFSVINVEPDSQDYRVKMSETDVAQFAEFQSKDGSSFVTEVPGQSTKTFRVEIYGGNTDIGPDAPLRVQATKVDGEITGEDRVNVDIVPPGKTGPGGRSQARNVPGIGPLHLLFLSLLSTLLVFTQS